MDRLPSTDAYRRTCASNESIGGDVEFDVGNDVGKTLSGRKKSWPKLPVKCRSYFPLDKVAGNVGRFIL